MLGIEMEAAPDVVCWPTVALCELPPEVAGLLLLEVLAEPPPDPAADVEGDAFDEVPVADVEVTWESVALGAGFVLDDDGLDVGEVDSAEVDDDTGIDDGADDDVELCPHALKSATDAVATTVFPQEVFMPSS